MTERRVRTILTKGASKSTGGAWIGLPRPTILESRSEFGAANAGANTRVIAFAGTVYKSPQVVFASSPDYNRLVTAYLASAGWSIVNLQIRGDLGSVGNATIAVIANVGNQYTDEQTRQSLIHDLGNVTVEGFLYGRNYLLSSINLQIVSNVNTVVDSIKNAQTANQNNGIIPTVGELASKTLFGDNINLFGIQIPQIVVYGALGLAIYTAVKK